MELILEKQQGCTLKPSSDEDAIRILKLPSGAGLRAEIKQIRNYKFHKKFFAMLQIGFEAFRPADQYYKGALVQKSFDRFRKDCVILAGYYEPVTNLKGEVRLEAKSISFANMSQDEFEDLYTAVCNVLLQKVLKDYTRENLDELVEKLINF